MSRPARFSRGRGATASFERLANLAIRARWGVLLGCALLTALSIDVVWERLQSDTSIESALASDAQPVKTIEELRGEFGVDLPFQVLVRGDVFTTQYFARLRALHADLAAIKLELTPDDASSGGAADASDDAAGAASSDFGFADSADDGWGRETEGSVIDETVSLINVRDTRWRGDRLEVRGLLDSLPRARELPALRERVLSDRTLVGRVVAPDGEHSLVLLRPAMMSEEDLARLYAEIVRVCERHQRDGFAIEVAGLPAFGASLSKAMLRDLGRTVTVSVLVLLLIVGYLFRNLLGVIGPILAVGQAVLWTFALMALSGVRLNVVNSVLPAFVLCVGMGDAVHVQSLYRTRLRHGQEARSAIAQAIGAAGVPILLTTLTTTAGLLSFRFATLNAIRDLGALGAAGVSLALLLTVSFLPAVLSFNRRPLGGGQRHAAPDFGDRFLQGCDRLSAPAGHAAADRTNALRTVAIALGLTALSLLGAAKVAISYDALQWLPNGDPTRRAFAAVDREVGGTSSVALLVDAPPGGTLRSREFMLRLEKLEHYIEAYRDPDTGRAIIGEPVSLVDVVKESWRAVHHNDPAHYRIPPTQRGVVDMLTLFENAAPEQLRRLATVDLTRSVVMIPVHWMDAWRYRPLSHYIEDGIEAYMGDAAGVRVTGSAFTVVSVVNSLITDLVRSLGSALLVITLMVVFMLRDFRLGLLAMVPNLLPLAWVAGVMGVVGIPLEINTLLVGSIGIGIAVDDTIHFFYHFQRHYQRDADVDRAIESAFRQAGRAMVSTSVILVAGFCVYIVAGMSNIRVFGTMVALTVTFALSVDLIVAPALLRLFYGRGRIAWSNSEQDRVAEHPGERHGPSCSTEAI